MKYVLENTSEFDRLEKQSSTEGYDFRRELGDFELEGAKAILDAGCGSGVVTRYLAGRCPGSLVTGCDASDERVRQARGAADGLSNVRFVTADITRLPFSSGSFDTIVCRYVLEHLNGADLPLAVEELMRCLKPGGKLRFVDIDGYFYNTYPQPPSLVEFLSILDRDRQVDMNIGRKMPYLLERAGARDIEWKIETLGFQGKLLQTEIGLIEERFRHTLPFIARLLGSEQRAIEMQRDYLDQLHRPGSVLFYNKFIVTASKPRLTLISREES